MTGAWQVHPQNPRWIVLGGLGAAVLAVAPAFVSPFLVLVVVVLVSVLVSVPDELLSSLETPAFIARAAVHDGKHALKAKKLVKKLQEQVVDS